MIKTTEFYIDRKNSWADFVNKFGFMRSRIFFIDLSQKKKKEREKDSQIRTCPAQMSTFYNQVFVSLLANNMEKDRKCLVLRFLLILLHLFLIDENCTLWGLELL